MEHASELSRPSTEGLWRKHKSTLVIAAGLLALNGVVVVTNRACVPARRPTAASGQLGVDRRTADSGHDLTHEAWMPRASP
jgi:hypothetical protein